MNQSQTILGVLIAVLILAVAYFFYFRPVPEEQAPPPAVEEEVMEETIPAPEDVAAIPADATITEDGIGIRFLQQGDGENFPTLEDEITIHYTGWQTDGSMFDSSRLRGEPSTFQLGGLIPGWKLSVPSMSKGSRALIWIPGDLAYDNRPDRPDAPKGMLVFDIELIDIIPGDGSGR